MKFVMKLRATVAALAYLSLSFRALGAVPERPAAEAVQATEHFKLYSDPSRLSAEAVAVAGRIAEGAYRDVSRRFPGVHEPLPIAVRLDARFRGATGYATPGGPGGHGGLDALGLRYAELDVLGLTPEFLFRHELTHLFVGRWEGGAADRRLAASPLGEGIADLVAGGRNGLGLPQSFAAELERHRAWTDPRDLFLRRRSGAPPQPVGGQLSYARVLQWRIDHYVEPSLFLAYVESRIGWSRMRDFYIDYAHAAAERGTQAAMIPVFRRYFDRLPDDFMSEWQAAIEKARRDPRADALRWLSERAYSAVQWYDFLTLGNVIDPSRRSTIDAQFRALNLSVAEHRVVDAEERWKQALRLVSEAAGSHAPIDFQPGTATVAGRVFGAQALCYNEDHRPGGGPW